MSGSIYCPQLPKVPFRPKEFFGLFYIYYNGKQWLTPWQKAAVVIAGIFGLAIGGMALSHYYRSDLNKTLHRENVEYWSKPFLVNKSI